MRTAINISRFGWLAILLACANGCCARWQDIPQDCAGAMYECDLVRLAHNLCSSGQPIGCTDPICSEDLVAEECLPCEGSEGQVVVEQECEGDVEYVRPRFIRPKRVDFQEVCQPICIRTPIRNCIANCREKVAEGPPPITYRPQLPPKFLTVPTGPVLTEVCPDAPYPDRRSVELSYGSQLSFPAGD